MQPSFENNRRIVGAIALVAALLVFFAAYAFSSSPAYGASMAKEAKKPKKKPKVLAFVFRDQLNVIGTNRNDRITLRLKPGNPSRLQVDTTATRYRRVQLQALALQPDRRPRPIRGTTRSRSTRATASSRTARRRVSSVTPGDDLRRPARASNRRRVVSTSAARAGPVVFGSRRSVRQRQPDVQDIAGVERFDLRARGGADNIVVNDLTGAGLGQLNARPGNDGAATSSTSRARRLQTSSGSATRSRSAASGRSGQRSPGCRPRTTS